MNINYEYMQDSDFLFKIDCLQIKTQYIKITLLDWKERPIQEIQGMTTGGSLNLDGKSAMRRTCNLSMFVPNENISNVTNINSLFSLNKKVYIEIGFKNTTNQYSQYPIIWMPLGTFIIINPSLSHSAGGISLSLQLKDKMCLLNGECGGVIPASTQFDEYDTIDETGNYVVERPVILQIIKEAVNHFGGEQLGKIIISDVDTRIKQTMKWIGSTPLYFINQEGEYQFTTDYSKVQGKAYKTYEYGHDVGYIFTDFTYPGELIENAGSNVVAVLDKIKNTLGNYEYYYDVYGNFIWQEIKNYLNTTHATVELDKLENSSYIVDMSKGKRVFDFKDSKLITSYSNNPAFNKIKNDFVVWGIRKTVLGNTVPIRFHLAIDKKPKIGNIYKCFFYVDPEDGLEKAKCPTQYDSKQYFPKEGNETTFYLDKSSGVIYKWNPDKLTYVAITGETVEEYQNKNNFPIKGAENILYVDLSTEQQYVWGVDTESAEFKNVQSQKEELIASTEEQIDILNNELKTNNKALDLYLDAQADYTKSIAEKEQKEEALSEQLTKETGDHLIASNILQAENILLTQMKNALSNKLTELNQPTDWTDPIGRFGEGNIDLYNRPQIENEDGSVSTVLSLGIYDETLDKEVLIPCVTEDGILSEEDAIEHYKKTNEYLGYFTSVEESNRYALELHIQQEILYSKINIEDKTYTLVELKEIRIPEQELRVKTAEYHEAEAETKMEATQLSLNEIQTVLTNEREELSTMENSMTIIENDIVEKNEQIQILKENEKNQINALNESLYEYLEIEAISFVNVETTDWRSELYLQGVQAEPLGIKSNYYYTELANEWPKHYDLRKSSYTNEKGELIYTGDFRDEYIKDPSTMDYYLDFIDSDSAIGYLSIDNIGRRTHVVNSNDINCLFECHIPDLVLIQAGQEDTQERVEECEKRRQGYVQVDPAVYGMLATGGSQRSAFVEIKDLLYEMTAYNESVSISTLPIYHLEPNIRVGIKNPDIDISGDYMINSISLPLDTNGTSSISAVRPITKM